MRFLVDAQLPPALARFLEARGYEAKAAREVGLREAENAAVWAFAQTGNWGISHPSWRLMRLGVSLAFTQRRNPVGS